MLEKISEGLNAMSKKARQMDYQMKKAEIIKCMKEIEDKKQEIEILNKRMSELMIETGTANVIWNNGEVELT